MILWHKKYWICWSCRDLVRVCGLRLNPGCYCYCSANSGRQAVLLLTWKQTPSRRLCNPINRLWSSVGQCVCMWHQTTHISNWKVGQIFFLHNSEQTGLSPFSLGRRFRWNTYRVMVKKKEFPLCGELCGCGNHWCSITNRGLYFSSAAPLRDQGVLR